MKMLKTVLKQFFSDPATILFPSEPAKKFDATRGHVVFDGSKCTSCSLCSKHCPSQAIAVDRAAKTWTIDRFRCVICNNCVDLCKFGALSFENTYSESATPSERSVEVFEVTYVKPERPKKEEPKAQ